ncbi:MAG TPA: hypothetical protein VL401_02820 [Alphaproteobacteria bacterium]|jgi:hypothetical protein|nr:hypothetical protein [Alphaproteobacteria bacterium]
MPATPERPQPEIPVQVQEHQEEFIVPENLQSSGMKVVQKNFTAQIQDDSGKPVIQTPPAQVITISPPSGQANLTTQAKGSISSSTTWLAAFWLRIIKKAIHFGWRIVGKTPQTT